MMCTLLMYPDPVGQRRPDNTAAGASGSAALTSPPRYLCRRLFQDGPTQTRPSTLLRSLEAELEKESAQRWNFDFRTGLPLPGRYSWVSTVVRPAATAEDSAAVAETPRTDNARRASKKTTTTTTQQSKITDFLRHKRKRDLSDSSADLSSKFRRRGTDSAAVRCALGHHGC